MLLLVHRPLQLFTELGVLVVPCSDHQITFNAMLFSTVDWNASLVIQKQCGITSQRPSLSPDARFKISHSLVSVAGLTLLLVIR